MLILAQPKTGYVAIDRAVPCMRGGCPNPLGNAGLLVLGFNRRHHLQNGPKFLVDFAQAYKTYNLNFADLLPSFHDGFCIASNILFVLDFGFRSTDPLQKTKSSNKSFTATRALSLQLSSNAETYRTYH